jgi:hypothetical protein
MKDTGKAVTGYDRPIDAKRSLDEAWQRAADKRGIEYANDIFPGGKAVTSEGKAPSVNEWTLDAEVYTAPNGRKLKSNVVTSCGKMLGKLTGFSMENAELIIRAVNKLNSDAGQ